MKIIALLLFLIISPIIILISICLFFYSSEKPKILFKQDRIGFHQKKFTIYKFKTMENNRVTKLGKYLRKGGLDEIPQLINIIKGEMSFIGPRPLTIDDIKRLKWTDKTHEKRWDVKPGITGIAQLQSTCSADLSLSNDLKYIENKSLSLDLRIFARSILIPVLGKKVLNDRIS